MSLYLIAAILILAGLLLQQVKINNPAWSEYRDGAAAGAIVSGLIALMIEVVLSGYEGPTP